MITLSNLRVFNQTSNRSGVGMIATILLCSLVICLVTFRCYRYLFDRPTNFPKGPPRLPLLGGYGIMLMINYKHLHKAATRLSEFYKSKLNGLHVGSYPTVLVNDFDTVKEVLNRREFDGRPDMYMVRIREKNFQRRGIFFIDGPDWKEQRRFMLRYLRDFGFGRRLEQLEVETEAEIRTMIDIIRDGSRYEHERGFCGPDGFVKCPEVFFVCFANVLLYVISGERIERAKAESVFDLGRHSMTFLRCGDDYGTVLSLIPWIRYLFPNATNYNNIRKSNRGVNAFIANVVRKFLDSHAEGRVRCFLDLYFQEMKKTAPKEEGIGFQCRLQVTF
uniref:Probable cytochrome P450 304a1 n=1 Tax=Culex pipiens TaxID=7175 RepID=A0A8D8FCJ7_CULPI